MNLIIERSDEGGAIYLGNLEAASNVEYLKRHNIGAVLTVAGGTGLRYNIHDIPMHEIINADDALYQDLSQYFNRMINFIETSRQKTNILIHCYAGISRSVTAVVAYIMRCRGWTYERTLSFVRSQRSIANPNPSFVRQLKRFEGQLKLSQHQYGGINASSSSQSHIPSHINQSQIVFAQSPTPTASRSKQVIDDLFDSPVKRASSSYGTRNLLTSYQSSYPPAPHSQLNSVYSSTSSLSTQLTYQQPHSRVLFNNQTTNPYSSSSSKGFQYAKYSSPSPAFSSASKNNLYVSRVPTAAQSNSRPYYSRFAF